MIVLSKDIKPNLSSAEGIKLFEILNCYGDIGLFWKQKHTDVSVSLLDGNMIIDGKNADFEELKSFVDMISPRSLFSNEDILKGLGLNEESEIVSVLEATGYTAESYTSENVSSKDVYKILKDAGLGVGEYEYFATDYCLRLNKGRLFTFAKKDKAAAVLIGTDYVLIHALASKEKGFGTYCLKGLMAQNPGKNMLVCAADSVKGFYIKNGFKEIYKAGYRRKQ